MYNNSFLNFSYALGRINILEKELLTINDIDRLLQAKKLKSKMQILEETRFGDFISEIRNNSDVEKALEYYLISFYEILDELGNKTISKYFRLKYDILNIKMIQIDAENDSLSKLGLIEPKLLIRSIKNQNWSNLASYFETSSKILSSLFEAPVQETDFELEKIRYSLIKNLADKSSLSLIKQLTKAEIDLFNIKSYLNSLDLFIEGGNINTSSFKYHERGPINNYYPKIFEKIENDEPVLDADLDNVFLSLIRKYKYDPIDANRLIAFFKAKELEAKNVRIILLAGLNDLEHREYQDHIRELYV